MLRPILRPVSALRVLVWSVILFAAAGLLAALRLRGDGRERTPALVVTGAAFPLRIETPAGELVLERAPLHILPAFASAVDFMLDLVPKERVIALPATAREWSALASEPSDWNALPTLAAFSAEEVLALGPDLILVQAWLGASTIETLRRKGEPVLELPLPNDWQGILATLRSLGAVVDARERADALIEELERRRRVLAERPGTRLRALCYSNWGSGGTTAGSDSTGDLLLELAGLANAAREVGLRGNPSIDHETILALAPDLFVVATAPVGTHSPSSAYLVDDVHLSALPAIRAGRIVTLPMHLFSTASHRIIDAAEALAREVDELE